LASSVKDAASHSPTQTSARRWLFGPPFTHQHDDLVTDVEEMAVEMLPERPIRRDAVAADSVTVRDRRKHDLALLDQCGGRAAGSVESLLANRGVCVRIRNSEVDHVPASTVLA